MGALFLNFLNFFEKKNDYAAFCIQQRTEHKINCKLGSNPQTQQQEPRHARCGPVDAAAEHPTGGGLRSSARACDDTCSDAFLQATQRLELVQAYKQTSRNRSA